MYGYTRPYIEPYSISSDVVVINTETKEIRLGNTEPGINEIKMEVASYVTDILLTATKDKTIKEVERILNIYNNYKKC